MSRAEAYSLVDGDPLAFLVAPDDVATFMARHWERGPAVFRATPARRAFFAGLASFSELVRLAGICEEEGEPLEFGLDVNAARYVGGRRETPNGEVADVASLEELYHNEGCTMQFHQPQRFNEDGWRLLAALERQLGCLVGSNAYLTPAGTQGLAPHWDDVEIFVVQTEGSKRWRLYGPPPAPAGAAPGSREQLLAACHLANQVSGDLAQEEIGEPSMEITLEVGDVLYMPRGTIHQAVAQNGPSAHLTISTYQRWTSADLLQYTVSVALANKGLQPLLPPPLKAGLPLNFLSAAALDAPAAAALAAAAGGFGPEATAALVAMAARTSGSSKGGSKAGGSNGSAANGGSSGAELAKQLAAACRSLADCLEGKEGGGELGPRLLQTAGDAMVEDFMRSRLPPHPAQLPARGPAPTLQDSVQCVGAGLFRLVPFHARDEGGCGPDCEEDHEHVGFGHGHSHGHSHGHKHSHGSGSDDDEDEEDGDEEASEEEEGEGRGGRHQHGPSCGPACHGHGEGEEEDEEEGEGEQQGAGPPAHVRLVSCLQNDRALHMMSGGGEEDEEDGSGSESDSESEGDGELEERRGGGKGAAAGAGSGGRSDDEEQEEEEQEDIVFPAEFAPALVQLLGSAPRSAGAGSSGRPVPVAGIALPDPDLQLQVAAALWEAGVLRTVQPEALAAAVKNGGKQGQKKAAGGEKQQQEQQEKKGSKGQQQQQEKKGYKGQQQQQGKKGGKGEKRAGAEAGGSGEAKPKKQKRQRQ